MGVGGVGMGNTLCECVRSNINFHPRNQEVVFEILEMILAFNVLHMTKTDGLMQNFKNREVTALNRQLLL